MQWSDVALPGAFVLGAVLGALAATRLAGYVLSYLRRRDDAD